MIVHCSISFFYIPPDFDLTAFESQLPVVLMEYSEEEETDMNSSLVQKTAVDATAVGATASAASRCRVLRRLPLL